MVETRDPDELEPHPKNWEIYREEDVDPAFVERIEERGQEETVKITPESNFTDADWTIISGHRRVKAAQEIGQEVEVEVVGPYETKGEELDALLNYNDDRNETPAQEIRIVDEWREVYRESPDSEAGTAVEKACELVSFGKTTYYNGRKVRKKAEAGNEVAQREWEKLERGEETIGGAYEEVVKAEERQERSQRRQEIVQRSGGEVEFVNEPPKLDLPDPGAPLGSEPSLEPESIFPYPGGKKAFCEWIISKMPTHKTYVEPFGGAANVLYNKPIEQFGRYTEVYNDRNDDLANFFEVLKNEPRRLQNRLQPVDFTKSEYEAWTERWYDEGWRPEDRVKWAAVLFFNRFAQWGAKDEELTVFNEDKIEQFHKKRPELQRFAVRFEDVVIENLDYRELLDKYDDEDTLFYFDPPYIGTEDLVQSEGFDHVEFAERLLGLEGKWLVSYGEEVPEALAQEADHEEVREVSRGMASGKPSLERLLMNYPEDEEGGFLTKYHEPPRGIYDERPPDPEE